jgi:hypothetical protein
MRYSNTDGEVRSGMVDNIIKGNGALGGYRTDGSPYLTDAGRDYFKQAKGKGGFMLDASIGKSLRLQHGRNLSINLSVSNITNNRKICTGGYEQSRSTNYTTSEGQEVSRTYNFQKNPKKFYAQGINGMLNVLFRF